MAATAAYDSSAQGLGSCRIMTSASTRARWDGNDGATATDPAEPHVPTRVTGTPSTSSVTVPIPVWHASTRLSRRPFVTCAERLHHALHAAANGRIELADVQDPQAAVDYHSRVTLTAARRPPPRARRWSRRRSRSATS